MPPIVWLVAGFAAGYFVRGWLGRELGMPGQLRGETERILDGVSRLHRSGALSNMDDLRLRHGSPRNNVQLLVTRARAQQLEQLASAAGYDLEDLYR